MDESFSEFIQAEANKPISSEDLLPKQTDLYRGSIVQRDRSLAVEAVAEAQAEMAAQSLEFEKQKMEQRNKLIKMGLIGAGVLLLIKVLK